jgi:3',5'-cyclic AMP phosphodiesterase CpdA
MPIHLPPISRRAWLAGATATAASLVIRDTRAADPAWGDSLALLSDTHVPANRSITSGNGGQTTNMTENFERVVAELGALERAPSHVVVNGDCAHLKGFDDDYHALAQTLTPLREKNLSVHLSMGNHDHRGRMYAKLKDQAPEKPIVEGRVISVLELPHANWFLLDSLFETNVTGGELGRAQLEWLATALDARADKPAIVMAHHHLQWEASDPIVGLRESRELFDLLKGRKQVKAYVYGHTHRWHIDQRDGIHLVNLPPTAYVFDKSLPNGWVSATVKGGGMTLELRALNQQHPQHGKRVELAWR